LIGGKAGGKFIEDFAGFDVPIDIFLADELGILVASEVIPIKIAVADNLGSG